MRMIQCRTFVSLDIDEVATTAPSSGAEDVDGSEMELVAQPAAQETQR